MSQIKIFAIIALFVIPASIALNNNTKVGVDKVITGSIDLNDTVEFDRLKFNQAVRTVYLSIPHKYLTE